MNSESCCLACSWKNKFILRRRVCDSPTHCHTSVCICSIPSCQYQISSLSVRFIIPLRPEFIEVLRPTVNVGCVYTGWSQSDAGTDTVWRTQRLLACLEGLSSCTYTDIRRWMAQKRTIFTQMASAWRFNKLNTLYTRIWSRLAHRATWHYVSRRIQNLAALFTSVNFPEAIFWFHQSETCCALSLWNI
jgi:hypothetical protein